ncbi:hypothetical protein [Paenibacillus sacheonensis]|uniref:Alpha-L-rhamnosidase six-hairpin glycosidase domain-containing protein n=1 Tax=Paenibacillus sacheonensis TaxID=742054 RepID=A0A7X4YKQ0_9BACL|nr:hypothetical protein [Paenibacillus sacheonensis]MBM7563275.1 hypothetical protein [Paenibacillus sacheonensis]NBC68167.1 hypothetical protein [Paenibacillus sacheonensis]
MTEQDKDAIIGLWPRTRSKRVFLHRPLDAMLVEARPDMTVLLKDAWGRKGDWRAGFGFAFAAEGERPAMLPHEQAEQRLPIPKVPVYECRIHQGGAEHRLTALVTEDQEGNGRLHLYLRVRNRHPKRILKGDWYFIRAEGPFSRFYVHPNEDYVPYMSSERLWPTAEALALDTADGCSGALRNAEGRASARYRVSREAGIEVIADGKPFQGAVRMGLRLEPGESAVMEWEIPYPILDSGKSAASKAANAVQPGDGPMLDMEEAMARCRRIWDEAMSGGMTIAVPDPLVQQVFDTTTMNHFQLLAQKDGASPVLPGQGGFNDYSVVYSWEAVHYIRALDRLGYGATVERVLDYFLSTQDGSAGPEGDISSAEGSFRPHIHWMCETGVVLGMLAGHYWMTRDASWLARVAECAVRACEWVTRERAAAKAAAGDSRPKHYGLLPPGRVHDWPDKGYFFFSDAQTWRGLHDMARALNHIGRPEGQRYLEEAEDYRACILRAVDNATHVLADGMSWVANEVYAKPGDQVGVYALDGPISLVDTGLWSVDDPRLEELEQLLRDRGSLNDLFGSKLPEMEDAQLGLLQQGFANGPVDLYYVNTVERVWHRIWRKRGRREDALRYFWSMMGYSTTLDTGHTHERYCPQLPWLSPWQPNGSANGRLFDMIADSLFEASDEGLHLLPCVPASWLERGKTIEVERASTPFGPVAFRVARESDRILAVELEASEELGLIRVTVPAAAGTIVAVSVEDAGGNVAHSKVEQDGETVSFSNPNRRVRIAFELGGD